MPFEKGRQKTGGRKPGVVNKDKQDIIEKINKLWEGYSEEQMLTDLLQLEAPERLKIMLGMAAEFCVPKLARQNIDITSDGEKITGIKITDIDGSPL